MLEVCSFTIVRSHVCLGIAMVAAWILSRTPTLDNAVYQGILGRLVHQGYDPKRLRLTPQPE